MRYLLHSILFILFIGSISNLRGYVKDTLDIGISYYYSYWENTDNEALLDSAEYYLWLAAKSHREADSLGEWLNACIHINLVLEQKAGPIEGYNFLDSIDNAIWRSPNQNNEFILLSSFYGQRGYAADNLGDYYSAKIFYEKNRELAEKYLDNHGYIVDYVYNPLGKIYLHLGDYDQAKFYTEEVLDHAAENPQYLAQSTSDLALIYQAEGEYEAAEAAYERALEMQGIDDFTLGLLHTNLGAMFVDLENWTEAEPHLLKAVSYYERAEMEYEAVEAYRLLGLIYMKKDIYSRSKAFLDKAINILEEDGEASIYTPEFALIHSYIGYWYQEQSLYLEALQAYQQSLHFLIPELDASDIHQLPLEENLYPEPLILDILESKGDAFFELYKNDSLPNNLMYALHSYQKVSKMEEVLQLSYDNESAKLNLLARSHERTESALEIAYELYRITGDELVKMRALGLSEREKEQDYLSTIFNISESSKSTILLESLKELEAQMLSKLPDSLEVELYQLKANWRYCQRQVQKFRQEQADASEIRMWEDKTRTARDAYQQFIKELEKTEDDYVAIKREWNPISLTYIQENILEEDQAMLEYFVGTNAIYLFIIDKDSTYFLREDFSPELNEWVVGLLESMSSYDFEKTLDFINYSRKLYDKLIQPIFNAGIELPSRLKIVPDGILGYLPFETLISTRPEKEENFKSYDYLLRQHQISYIYSARLLEQILALGKSKSKLKSFLGVAPVFEGSRKFSQLYHSVDEVQTLCDTWKGKALIGAAADKQAFLKDAPKHNILHIYSHAVANAEAPHMSYIGFYEKGEEDDYLLHLADIYAMKLEAAMVVLSACETQTGMLHEGEGLMSLARGFIYAGSKSVVGTRWKVNSTSTSKIMRYFYKELANGESKDIALTKAKLYYLFEDEETDKMQAHPYFWAAYAPIGDMNSISLPFFWGFFQIFILITCLTMLGLGLFLLKRRQK